MIENFNATRSNFDAALAALNELCRDESIISMMDASSLKEFCTNRKENIVTPFSHGNTDTLYIPGNDLGTAMSKAMTLFGEHDVFMEMDYPMIYNVLVPRELVPREKELEMPICNARNFLSSLVPYFRIGRKEGQDLDCPAIHPIKFGNEKSSVYWKGIVEDQCSTCEWKNENQTYWEIVD